MQEEIANLARKLSRSELFRFHAYVESYGIQATLVGGWAVFAHNPYLESIDIDIVVPNDRIPHVEHILIEQCKWIPTTTDMPIWKRFSKQIPDAGLHDHIIFDLLSTDLVNAFHEDNSKKVPFHICLQKNQFVKKSINDLVNISVPRKELLLLYKLKAYRDRIFDLHNREITEREKFRLTAKATKDLSDTIALLDPDYGPLDLMTLRSLVSKQGLQFLAITVKELTSHSEAIEQYRGTSTLEVQGWVEKMMAAFQ